jgi:hypothetical protein
MYLKNYSVRVFKSNGQAANEQNGYVSLVNGEQYRLRLKNNDNRQCVCKVTIDGKIMGQFLVNAQQHVDLERPDHDSGKFTFYTIDSVEGKKLELATEVSADQLGLITVAFVPIRPLERQYGFQTSNNFLRKTKSSSGMHVNRSMTSGYSGSMGSSAEPLAQMNLSAELEDSSFCSMEGLDVPLASIDWTEYESAPKKRGGTGLTGESNVEYKQVEIAPERFLFTEMATINLRLVAVEAYETVRKLTATPNATPIPAPV